ncbi:MAG: cyclic nucleotide-binding domain-containing protein [Chloroflexi bacterium]|nr:cyclic nucleotide-binding domain-containing protein [Chloroflexota bacterium]
MLAGVDLFRGVSAKELERLERVARPRQFAAGETIVREGETGIALFVVLSGKVRVTQQTGAGQERELRTIGPGGAFGEMALLGERPRTATVTAVEPTECLALHRRHFLDELRQSPEIAIRLLETLSQRLVDAERRTQAAG